MLSVKITCKLFDKISPCLHIMYMTIDNNAKHFFFSFALKGAKSRHVSKTQILTEHKIIMIGTVVEFSHLTIYTLDPN